MGVISNLGRFFCPLNLNRIKTVLLCYVDMCILILCNNGLYPQLICVKPDQRVLELCPFLEILIYIPIGCVT